MIFVGEVVGVLIEFVVEFVWTFGPWHGDKRKEES